MRRYLLIILCSMFQVLTANSSCFFICAFNHKQQPQPNYYDVLNEHLQEYDIEQEVDLSSSQDDLRKVYLHLSRKIHPDKNNSDNATERFQTLGTIYDVLKNPTKRTLHDAPLKPSIFSKLFSYLSFPLSFLIGQEEKND